MTQLTLKILDQTLAIYRLPPDADVSSHVYDSEFYSITRTDDELSIVCSASCHLESESSSLDWQGYKVIGPLDFALTGILAELSAVLAGAQISIFAISTYDTDYILVKAENMTQANRVLKTAGYTVL